MPSPSVAHPPTSAPTLTGQQQRRLRALAHHLVPVVQVGQKGVTEGVLQAVQQALLDHELIKVRLLEPEDKKALAQAVAEGSHAALCGLIGHTVLLYRPHPEKPVIEI